MSSIRSRKRARKDDDDSFDAYVPKPAKIQRRKSTKTMRSVAAEAKENRSNRESLSPEEIALAFLQLSGEPVPLATPKKSSTDPLTNTFSPSLKAASRARKTPSGSVLFTDTPNVQINPPSLLSNSTTLSSPESPQEEIPKSNSIANLKTAKRRLSQIETVSAQSNIKVRRLESGKSTRKPATRSHALLYVF